jgi:hypothetical protein
MSHGGCAILDYSSEDTRPAHQPGARQEVFTGHLSGLVRGWSLPSPCRTHLRTAFKFSQFGPIPR